LSPGERFHVWLWRRAPCGFIRHPASKIAYRWAGGGAAALERIVVLVDFFVVAHWHGLEEGAGM